MTSQTPITLDPSDPFERVVIEAVAMNRAKAADYAGVVTGDGKWQNFYDTAYQMSQTPGHSVEQLIATKQARLRVLLPRLFKKVGKPKNESVRDTLLDRCVYSTIAVALFDEGSYDEGWSDGLATL
jgi:hypothetical protein